MKKSIILILLLSLLPIINNCNNDNVYSINTQILEYSKKYYSTDKRDIRVMTYNLLSHEIGFDGIASPKRKIDTISLINTINPHILCLQEMSADYYSSLKNSTRLKFASPISTCLSHSMTVLLYNPARLSLIRSGSVAYKYSTNARLRNYVWALFEDNSTREFFIVVNTHLNLYEQATAYPILQAKELLSFCYEAQAKYNCPLVLAGDLNSYQSLSTSNTAVYDYISLYYKDSKSYAKNKSYGTDKSLSSPITDHIFCTDNINISSYTLLSVPWLNTLSDHYPIFIDVNLESAIE